MRLTRLYRANGNERSSGLITVTVTQERNSAVEGFNINNLFVVASDGTKHLTLVSRLISWTVCIVLQL